VALGDRLGARLNDHHCDKFPVHMLMAGTRTRTGSASAVDQYEVIYPPAAEPCPESIPVGELWDRDCPGHIGGRTVSAPIERPRRLNHARLRSTTRRRGSAQWGSESQRKRPGPPVWRRSLPRQPRPSTALRSDVDRHSGANSMAGSVRPCLPELGSRQHMSSSLAPIDGPASWNLRLRPKIIGMFA
jgi:hypothetical protein